MHTPVLLYKNGVQVGGGGGCILHTDMFYGDEQERILYFSTQNISTEGETGYALMQSEVDIYKKKRNL